MTEKIYYIAEDGKQFESKIECENYEKENLRKNYFFVSSYGEIITSKTDFDEEEITGMYFEDENAFNQFKADYANCFDFSSICYSRTTQYYLWNPLFKEYEYAEIVLEQAERIFNDIKADFQALRSNAVSNKRNKLLTE